MRITYTYLDGPLAGRTVPHRVLTDELLTPILHPLTTCAKDDYRDFYAQGIYHVEKREEEWVAVHHKSAHDQDWHELPPEPPKEASGREVSVISISAGEAPDAIKIPDGHPMAKRLMRRLGPLIEHLKKKEEPGDSRGG